MSRRNTPLLIAAVFAAAACAPATVNTLRYSSPPPQPGTISTRVQILLQDSPQPNVKLGEIFVDAPWPVSREQLENTLKSGAANLGADAAWIVRDDTRLFPVVYVDPWWGPVGVGTGGTRRLIAIAIKYR
jgi:hypothetical protein